MSHATRHRWVAFFVVALVVLTLPAWDSTTRAKLTGIPQEKICRAPIFAGGSTGRSEDLPYESAWERRHASLPLDQCEVVLTRGEPVQQNAPAPAPRPSAGGTGCPAGTFKPMFKRGCARPSPSGELPLEDGEPMRFAVIQLDKSISYLQAIGTITRETPAEFARFMASDAAKASRSLALHSPGGDPLAGIELGRAIREARLETSIGRSITLEGRMLVHRYRDSRCVSACALAFLGGVSRIYGGSSIYGFPRPDPPIGDASSEAVRGFLEEMGVDYRPLLAAASRASPRDGFLVVPESLGREWRIIFDGFGQTTFSLEERRGRTVATFNFETREHRFGGVLYCERGRPALAILDLDDSIATALHVMDGFPVEFEAGDRRLTGEATYVGRTPQSPPLVVFMLPSLDENSFSGNGLVLTKVTNPQLPVPNASEDRGAAITRLTDALAWGDAEATLRFRIAADNGERTLPQVLGTCHRRTPEPSFAP